MHPSYCLCVMEGRRREGFQEIEARNFTGIISRHGKACMKFGMEANLETDQLNEQMEEQNRATWWPCYDGCVTPFSNIVVTTCRHANKSVAFARPGSPCRL